MVALALRIEILESDAIKKQKNGLTKLLLCAQRGNFLKQIGISNVVSTIFMLFNYYYF